MSSLCWKLNSDWFRSCPDCKVIPKKSFNEVYICPFHKAKEAQEDARLADLPPTEENIRAILNDTVELFSCTRIYEYFYEKWMHEMPYGTAKARDGDPDVWILHRLEEEYPHLMEEEPESA